MSEPSLFQALTQGTSGVLLTYASVELPLLAGLRRGRASLGKWLAAPLAAVPAVLAAGMGMSFLADGMKAAGLGMGAITAAGVGVSMATGYLTGRLMARSTPAPEVHRRGAVVLETPEDGAARAPRSRTRSLSRASGATPRSATPAITLGGVPLSLEDETKHFKIIGTTGTGKSTAIRELLEGAFARGDRAIIADPDGGYLARFYDPKRGDLILNPFDSRSVKWDLFGEISTAYDVEQLARSLIPDQAGGDRSWTGYARTFFTAVTRQAHAQGMRDVGELYRLLVVAPAAELRQLVTGTPAQPFLEEQNTRMFDSIRSVASSAVGALGYVAQQKAAGLSIREWVREGARRQAVAAAGNSGDARGNAAANAGAGAAEGFERRAGGVLFIPYRAGEIAALRSTISAWMRVGIFEAMNQPEGDQRLWFVVDELDALGQIDGLKDALARLRKFGGRIVLGLQSIAQVSATYGRDAQTMVENASNSLILRSSGSEHGGTSQFASRLIGEREVVRTSVSRSRRATDFFASVSHSQHLATESAVLGSEIEQLPDLEGYLRIASQPFWQRIRLAQPDRAAAMTSTDGTGAPASRASARESGSTAVLADDVRRAAVSLWQRARATLARGDEQAGPSGDSARRAGPGERER